MRFISFTLMCLMFFNAEAAFSHPEKTMCEAPERVSEGHVEYNENLCRALMLLDEGDYIRADALLVKTAELPLFEMPNFMLEPLRAEAKFGQGDKSGAIYHLKKAELFLMVYSGILSCRSFDDEDKDLSGLRFGSENRYSREMVQDVADKMCWVSNEGFLQRSSLATIEHEYALFQRLQSVKKKYK